MKTYNIKFVTNSEQKEPFTETVQANSAKEARKEICCQAQIPDRFIIACKLAK
jgi:hypothetical protein